MNWFQGLCIVILLYGIVAGWRNGLIKELFSLIGFALGLYLAFVCNDKFGMDAEWAVVFCIAFPLVFGYIASLFSHTVDNIIVIGKLNKLLGAVVGLAKCGILIYCLSEALKTYETWKDLKNILMS